MSRIIMGYWSCESCGTKDIEGLVDVCPSCGARKPADTRYYMKGREVVTKEQLEKAGIGEDECDGEHKEWVCEYCGYLNNYSATECYGCGASKEEAEREYGDTPAKETEIHEPVPASKPGLKKRITKFFKILLGTLLAFVALLVILFFPTKRTWTITGLSWEREIIVEEYRTIQESDWSVPEGVRVYKEEQEIKSYDQKISHYEDVVVTKSRDVIAYYDTEYEYVDNGNGTFTERSYQVPVYDTEYYEDIEKQPVYIDIPVYATKYYYEYEKWVDVDKYLTSGMDKNAYWDESYTLAENQRDEKRREQYHIVYDKGESLFLPYDEWITYDIGDKCKVYSSLFGYSYSEQKISEKN